MLDLLDGFLESKDTVEVSLVSVPVFLYFFCMLFVTVFQSSQYLTVLYLASLKCHVSCFNFLNRFWLTSQEMVIT